MRWVAGHVLRRYEHGLKRLSMVIQSTPISARYEFPTLSDTPPVR